MCGDTQAVRQTDWRSTTEWRSTTDWCTADWRRPGKNYLYIFSRARPARRAADRAHGLKPRRSWGHIILVIAALAICAITAALLRSHTRSHTRSQAPPPTAPGQPPPADPA